MANPWEGKLFESDNRRVTKNSKQDTIGLIFTILMIIFTVVVVLMIGVAIYLSVGGSKNGIVASAYYTGEQVQQAVEAAPVETTAEQTEEVSTGATLEVLAGEGAGQIAARAGISVDDLYALNPDKMTGPDGTWYANPGDVVKID